ncbi:hypothetical protein M0802_005869 [Mischocyttarus mexicanus]|nr:hypothetical protein M0802_005869 [Mischocyttarus mexicanus]
MRAKHSQFSRIPGAGSPPKDEEEEKEEEEEEAIEISALTSTDQRFRGRSGTSVTRTIDPHSYELPNTALNGKEEEEEEEKVRREEEEEVKEEEVEEEVEVEVEEE